MVHLDCGAATDTGRVRTHNEDSYFAAAPVFVVADGMGGHHGGEVASAIATEEFGRLAHEGYDPAHTTDVVVDALVASQRRIQEYGRQHHSDGEIEWYAGTTVAAALLCEDEATPKWLLANLGDSRIYKVHEGRLDQVSVDHSLVQELLDSGEIDAEEAAVHPERHVITRALGGPVLRAPDFFVLPLSSAERVLLCSDGVSGMIDDTTIHRILTSTTDPRDAADALVKASLEAGGEDNATAIVIDVVGLPEDVSDAGARTEPVSLEDKLGALP
ncbi:protein phosphatase 2C domain-containing protein [Nocardioides sp. AE5]|uniref:PP2C family protein-serine/threonine phosphatase n=1 Tax=Nocardioides sp. AE5 TaxID=2962573 RepID=UPI0028819213|nr:protein phosphatase 2C domain-containing protein [Nocardioides sp. AE5]MDT0203710.1 protein phosphatase 2C domain-containing protein [Nocardioides sp. AE5]